MTRPVCGHAETLTMALDSSQIRHDCAACGAALKPKPGDCCVFCSCGDVPCPPMQESRGCCGGETTPPC
ncbi:MAG TPA: GDCCVxC domain-containing (seleno)protein [Methylocystis sp.]